MLQLLVNINKYIYIFMYKINMHCTQTEMMRLIVILYFQLHFYTDLWCFFCFQFSNHLPLFGDTSERTRGTRAWTFCCRSGDGALWCWSRGGRGHARFVLLSRQLFKLSFKGQELLHSGVHLLFRGFICLELPHQFSLGHNAGEQGRSISRSSRWWGGGGSLFGFTGSCRLSLQQIE